MRPSNPLQDAGAICIDCGLCCDGTLHGSTTVSVRDEGAVTAVGLRIEREQDRNVFRQPCPLFSCGRCSVYRQRPAVCSNYECALLASVRSGETDEPTARARVATAKRLRDAVRGASVEEATPAARFARTQQLKTRLQATDALEREQAAKALLDLAALDHFLRRYFLKEEAPTVSGPAPNNER